MGKNDARHCYPNPSAVVDLLEAKEQGNIRSIIVLLGEHWILSLHLEDRPETPRDGAIALERHRAALLLVQQFRRFHHRITESCWSSLSILFVAGARRES